MGVDPSGMMQATVTCNGVPVGTVTGDSYADLQQQAQALCNTGGSATVVVDGGGGGDPDVGDPQGPIDPRPTPGWEWGGHPAVPQSPQPKPCNPDAFAWAGLGTTALQNGLPNSIQVGSNFKVYQGFYGNQYVDTLPAADAVGYLGVGFATVNVGVETFQAYNGTLPGGKTRLGFDAALSGVAMFADAPVAIPIAVFFMAEPWIVNSIQAAPGGTGTLSNQNLHYGNSKGNERCF